MSNLRNSGVHRRPACCENAKRGTTREWGQHTVAWRPSESTIIQNVAGVSKGRANLHEGMAFAAALRPFVRLRINPAFGPQGLRCTGPSLFKQAFRRFDKPQG